MAGSVGAKHSPLNDVRTLRDLVRRYHLGFPIIKELLQNADDAGATTLDIGWVPGLTRSRHPLLRGPAIFVRNNGPFMETNAWAIQHIGVSDKGGQQSAIGKFGYGLKSVFHLCEAFAFLWSTQTPDKAGGFPLDDGTLFNPWQGDDGKNYHPEWDGFSVDDTNEIADVVQRIGAVEPRSSEPWFCLWIPLRRQEHLTGVEPISPRRYGDEATPPKFLANDLPLLAEELTRTLAMLRSIEKVRVWLPTDGSEESPALQVQLEPGAQRRRFDGEPLEPGYLPLSGRVTISGSGLATSDAGFAGVETFLAEPRFAEFQKRSAWPKEAEEDLVTGELRTVSDKALPHAAAVLTRWPARREGALSASRAVFLSIGDPDADLPCPGNWDYDVSLHGYYFVNSDRTGIELDDPATAGDDDARQLRLSWNRELSKTGTMACVLPALERFRMEMSPSVAELGTLTAALDDLEALREEREGVCKEHQWVYCLASPGSASWRLVPSTGSVFLLPDPPSNEPELFHSVFPGLERLSSGTAAFSTQNSARITASPVTDAWREGDVEALLDSVLPGRMFRDDAQLRYFREFLESNSALVRSSAALQDSLVRLLRSGLEHLGPAHFEGSSDFQEIVRLLQADRVLSIPEDLQARAAVDGTYRYLASLESSVLIVPESLEPRGLSDPDGVSLALDEAAEILEALAAPPVDLQTPAFVHLRTGVATRVAQASKQQQLELEERCGALRVFWAWDGLVNEHATLSWNDLADIYAGGFLFSHRENEPIDLAAELQAALSEARVGVVRAEVVEALFSDPELPRCDSHASVEALFTAVSLNEFDSRKALLQVLSKDLRTSSDPRHVGAVRYLLHGRRSRRDSNAELFVEATGVNVWSRLAEQALRDDGWRVIPFTIAGEIPQSLWELVNLRNITFATVTSLIKDCGPGRMDCAQLSDDDRRVLLRDIEDLDVLRGLRIHRDVGGQLRTIGDVEYLQSSYPMDPEFHGVVTLLEVQADLENKQQRLVNGRWWSGIFAIDVALAQPDVADFCQPILNALKEVSGEWTWGADRLQRLQNTAWLPTADGIAVRPSEVIHLPGVEQELARLASATPDSFFDTGMLQSEILNHDAFSTLERVVLPNAVQALEMLGLMIAEGLPDFIIGALPAQRFELTRFLHAFASAPPEVMRCASLLEAIANHVSPEQCAEVLIPSLLSEISTERTVRILEFLADQHALASVDGRAPIEEMHLLFLESMVSSSSALEVVRGIRLQNRLGEWRPTESLCSGFYNLDDSYVLESRQATALAGLLMKTRQENGETEAARPPMPGAVGELDPERSAELLRTYFEPWQGACRPEVIGGFLAVLGDEPALRELAERYLGQRDVDVIRDQINWKVLSEGTGGGGEDVHQVMEAHTFLMAVAGPDEPLEVRNLLGAPILVPIHGDFDHLLVGDPFSGLVGGRTNQLTLRTIDPQHYDDSQLSELLRDTTREVLQKVYWQQPSDFDQFWKQLEDSQALQLEVTQVRILKHLLSSLKQLRLHTDPTLWSLFRKHDDADQIQVEADLMPDQATKQAREDEAGGLRREAIEELKNLLTNSQETAERFLASVRRGIQQDYQYQSGSVLFELFQNADDAAVELLELRGQKEDQLGTRCVVSWDDEGVYFAHWGRAINEFRISGDSAIDSRARGFHQDLEKMLMIGASDKGVEAAPHEVTGKFGMGFKSVFLLSDSPRVLSGELAFDIAGGVYPRRLTGSPYQALRERLEDNGPGQRGGTLIELPLRSDMRSTYPHDLERFRDLAPILLVFARSIRRLSLRPTGGTERSVVWRGDPVLGVAQILTGRLSSEGEPGMPGRALVLQVESGSLLLGLGARGIERLPAGTPGLWVTAPTAELQGLGFALNGSFDLDVGRAQLARSSDHNDHLAETMGLELGAALVELHDAASGDWDGFRSALDLARDATPYRFWESMLDVLGKPFIGDEEGSARPALSLLRRVLWNDERHGMGRLLDGARVLPSGLPGTYRQLVQARNVSHEITGLLADELPFGVFAGLASFAERVNTHTAITSPVARSLPLRGWMNPPSLGLATALEWEVQPALVVLPHLAERLGGILTQQALDRLERGTPLQQAEYGSLRELLSRLRFEARDSQPHGARALLIESDDAPTNPDEAMRAQFAPAANLLSTAYAGDALMFFKLCRRELDAPAERLAEWGKAATDANHRLAFLRYMLSGELGQQVQRQVRDGDDLGWLPTLQESPLWEQMDISAQERVRVLAGLHLLPVQPYVSATPEPAILGIDASDALERIAAWWAIEGPEYIRKYDRSRYLDGRPSFGADFLEHRSDLIVRSGWVELFVLGASHTFGRTRDEQHRAFLKMCRDRGWFDVFAARRNDFSAERWMDLIRHYFDRQMDTALFYDWLRLFVPIFQISSWLDEYVELFLGADRYLPIMPLDEFLSPASAPAFQGGGISAPPLKRTLGIGANFVLRELARAGLITNEHALRYCYVPSRPVRGLMEVLGCEGMEDGELRTEQSGHIADFLRERLGVDEATFNLAFDMPLAAVARDQALQDQLFGSSLSKSWDEDENEI